VFRLSIVNDCRGRLIVRPPLFIRLVLGLFGLVGFGLLFAAVGAVVDAIVEHSGFSGLFVAGLFGVALFVPGAFGAMARVICTRDGLGYRYLARRWVPVSEITGLEVRRESLLGFWGWPSPTVIVNRVSGGPIRLVMMVTTDSARGRAEAENLAGRMTRALGTGA
jgi:hypothetical protein